MKEIAFTIFNFDVRWYAIILTSGMICALILLIFMLKKSGQPADLGLEIFLWVIPIALIFARLFYVIPREEYYPIDSWAAFVEFFAVWKGGITIVGGLVGGIVGTLLCCLVRKKSFMRIADCMVCPVLVGQIIGRWGNYVNQEVYGLVVTNESFQHFPIAVFIESTGQWHMASFFYEMMLNLIALIVFLVLFFKYKDKLKVGTITVGYLFWYFIVRACLEFVKYDPLSAGGVKVLQTMCFVFAGICLILLILTQTKVIKWETEKMKERHFAPPPPPKPKKNKGAKAGEAEETTFAYDPHSADNQPATETAEVKLDAKHGDLECEPKSVDDAKWEQLLGEEEQKNSFGDKLKQVHKLTKAKIVNFAQGVAGLTKSSYKKFKTKINSASKKEDVVLSADELAELVKEIDGVGAIKIGAIVDPKSVEKTKEVIEPKTEEAIEPKAEEAVEPKVEEVIEPKAEEVIEPKTEEVIEPKAEEVIEPKAEEVIEPKAEEVIEPKAEEVIEPKTEEVIEPKTEEVIEPKTEDAVKPKAKPKKKAVELPKVDVSKKIVSKNKEEK